MRRLATVRTISDIRPIEGADRIVVAQVDGWECVVQKDEFKVGDNIVYIEVDSIVSERPEFEFLRSRRFRVKTIKLRNQISQGLVLPMNILPPGYYRIDDDVTDILGIKKHDPQAMRESWLNTPEERSKLFKWFMRFKWFRRIFAKSKRKGGFPDWIVKTDEERIQNKTAMFFIEKKNETLFTATEKLDGQSVTFFLKKVGRKKYEFGVCSRNIYLGKPDSSSYWIIAQSLNIEHVLKSIIGSHDHVVLQGEIIGPDIQGNKYQLGKYDFYAFNLIYPDNKKIHTLDMPQYLSQYGIKTVPVIHTSVPLEDTIADVVEDAKGNSNLLASQKREGLVWRNFAHNISFKAINPDFLLACDS
jgi:hypothetical protein